MKPLLSTKVKRGEILREWTSAKDQATMDGLADFRARQEARRIKAQGKQAAPVINIKRSLKP